MKFYKIPINFDWMGNTYSDNLELLLTDRSITPFDYHYDVIEYKSISSCIKTITELLSFSPYGFQLHSTNFTDWLNNASSDMQEFVSIFSSFISHIKEWGDGGGFSNYNINNISLNMGGGAAPLSNGSVGAINQTCLVNFIYAAGYYSFQITFNIIPEHAIDHGEITYYEGHAIQFTITTSIYQENFVVTEFRCTVQPSSVAVVLYGLQDVVEEIGYIPGASYYDPSDPYESTGSISNIGGGDGLFENPDLIDQILTPDLPDISAISTGLLTIFAPSLSQVQSLGDFLWSSAFDVDTLKKLFSDPMAAIIGLAIVPIKPVLAGNKTVKIGNIDTGISMPYVTKQFVSKSMGSVSIKKYIGSFMDYSPYTQIQLYLPYIGIKTLSPDDVMDDTLNIEYHIDILTGGCAAIISTSKKGVLYQYNGNCIANVPLTAINYSGAIQNAVSAVGNIATAAVGMATGAAPLTAVGVAGLASNAANTAINSKPIVERSGNMGGAAGMLSVQKPYLIINRPRLSTPSELNKFGGYPSNINMRLGECSGFTMIDSIRLDNIPATENEKQELLSILQKGVIF